MLKRSSFLFLVVFVTASHFQGNLIAQQAPLKGVVWEQPEDAGQAAQDLMRMKRAGVQAVRTGLITNEQVLTLADTLGLVFFQDLPIAYLTAEGLIDSLPRAQRLIQPLLQAARRHPSARYIGLARLSDTSDPAACTYFESLASDIRRQVSDTVSVYYTTLFTSGDRCGHLVDLVLVDFRDLQPPDQMRARWRVAADSLGAEAVGIGALGTWVLPSSEGGLRRPYSEEAQARHLETSLHWFFITLRQDRPAAVFIYRWRDDQARFPSPGHNPEDPYLRSYGITDNGEARAAFDVMEGFYSGRQTVFAFPGGKAPAHRVPWAILVGWGILLMLGLFYALSPRMRQMIQRYFLAKGFYRDAVREGRDMLLGSSSVFLVALSASVGMLVAVILETIQDEPAFIMLFRWLPVRLADVVVSMLAQPLLVVLLIGSFYAFSLVLWSTVLSAISRRRYPLTPGQVVMLVVWPRWPILLLMLVAMILPTVPHEFSIRLCLVLAMGLVVLTLVGMVRTLYDFTSIARVSPLLSIAAAFGNPVGLLLVLIAAVGVLYTSEIKYLWRLITST